MLALQEARWHQHDYVGSEHLVAGLLRETSPEIGAVFREQGIDARQVLEEVDRLLVGSAAQPKGPEAVLTPRVRRILVSAFDLAGARPAKVAGTTELFLAILLDPEYTIGPVLAALGFDLARLIDSLHCTPPEQNRDAMVRAPGGAGSSNDGLVDPSVAELERLFDGQWPPDVSKPYEFSTAVQHSLMAFGKLLTDLAATDERDPLTQSMRLRTNLSPFITTIILLAAIIFIGVVCFLAVRWQM